MEKNLSQLITDLNLNIKYNSRGTDKLWPHNYINGFYEKEFYRFKKLKCRILEIGFRHGASLHLWANYFSNAEIIGIDDGSDISVNKENPVNVEWLNDKKISLKYGNAYSYNFSKTVTSKFDIIIDDGPHTLESQYRFLNLYLKKLNVNGVAIIEDLQKYGGIVILLLILKTPLKYHVEFYDFRKKTKLGDDILYVVRNLEGNQLFNRISTFISACKYLITDGIFRLLKKTINQFFRLTKTKRIENIN